MIDNYKKAYGKLYRTVYGEGHRKYVETNISSFVAMRGAEYDKQEDVRLMLVGRATGATPVPFAVAFSVVIPGCNTADAVDALSLLPDGGGWPITSM